jgi:peptidoglycan-associated lipoprotein
VKARLLIVFLVAAGLMVACGGGAKTLQQTTPPPGKIVQEPAAPAVPEEPMQPAGSRVALAPVYFDYDKSDIRSDQRGALADNAKALEANADVARVVIEGHCDERGTNEYNMALGQRRADSVKSYFVNYGIPRTKLSTVSFGEERPADPGHTDDAWARNRRAEFVTQK